MRLVSAAIFTLTLLTSTAGWAQATAGFGIGQAALDHGMLGRPLTMDQGMTEVYAAASRLRIQTPFGEAETTFSAVGVGFGVTDFIEAGLSTAWNYHPDFEWAQFGTIYGVFGLLETKLLSFAPTASVIVDLNGDGGFQVAAGPELRLILNDQLALLAGQNLLLFDSRDEYVNIAIPVGIAYNPTDALALRLDLQLANYVSVDGGQFDTLNESIPVRFSALWHPAPLLDVFAGIDFLDAGEFVDLYYLTVGVVARF